MLTRQAPRSIRSSVRTISYSIPSLNSSAGLHLRVIGLLSLSVSPWILPTMPRPLGERLILALAIQDTTSRSGSRKASTASAGVLPGKGDQHGHPGDRGVIGIVVAPRVPLGEELVGG